MTAQPPMLTAATDNRSEKHHTERSRKARTGQIAPVVERTVSWLAGCRRLHRRYKRKAEHFLAFVGPAALLIGYRRMARTIRA
jgi:transposase